MTKLMQIPFEEEAEDIKDKVVTYWSKRAESFSEHKHEEIHSRKKQLWQSEFLRHFSADDKLSVLDVGCGAGFFEMVLSDFDFDVTGVDLTPEMIERGKELLSRHGAKARLMVMDAEKLDFLFHLPSETMKAHWNIFFSAYLGTNDPGRIEDATRRLSMFAAAKIPYMIETAFHMKVPEDFFAFLTQMLD